MRVGFAALIRGEPACIAAVAINDPQVVGVNKNNVLITKGGLPQQAGTLGIQIERSE